MGLFLKETFKWLKKSGYVFVLFCTYQDLPLHLANPSVLSKKADNGAQYSMRLEKYRPESRWRAQHLPRVCYNQRQQRKQTDGCDAIADMTAIDRMLTR